MTQLDDFLNIDTPENVAFDYEVVGIGSRFMAAAVDTILIVVLQLVAYIPFSLIAAADEAGPLARWLPAFAGLLAFALLWGYYIFFEIRWNGESPGKRWVGIQVIRQDGLPITLTESIVRNLVRLVDFMPLFYGVGVVSMFIDGRARRLGDLAAGTLVVRAQPDIDLDTVHAVVLPRPPMMSELWPAMAARIASWPIERLSAADIHLAEQLIQRHRVMADGGTALLRQTCERFVAVMDVERLVLRDVDLVHVLAQVVREHRRWTAGDRPAITPPPVAPPEAEPTAVDAAPAEPASPPVSAAFEVDQASDPTPADPLVDQDAASFLSDEPPAVDEGDGSDAGKPAGGYIPEAP